MPGGKGPDPGIKRKRKPKSQHRDSGASDAELMELMDQGVTRTGELARKTGVTKKSIDIRKQYVRNSKEESVALLKARSAAKSAESGDVGAVRAIGEEVRVSFERVREASDFNHRVMKSLEAYMFHEPGTESHEEAVELLGRLGLDGKEIVRWHTALIGAQVGIGKFGLDAGKSLQYAFKMQQTQNALFAAMERVDRTLAEKFVMELMKSDALLSVVSLDAMKRMGMLDAETRRDMARRGESKDMNSVHFPEELGIPSSDGVLRPEVVGDGR